jgi:cytochrome c biogenesis protein ResB
MKLLILSQPITFSEIISSTGLQIKTDPGIPIIYSGFFFLMIKYFNKLYNIFTNLDNSKKSKTFYWWNN